MTAALGHIPAEAASPPTYRSKIVDKSVTNVGFGNPHLADAELMTRDQERKFIGWLDKATEVKRRRANHRRKAEVRRLAAIQSLPERLAAQTALIEANGGRLPPRWLFETATKNVQGKIVEYRKRVANRPAYVGTLPYDPEIDGRGHAVYLERAFERRERIDVGFRLHEDILLSGCLVQKGLFYKGFKSEALGTKSALRWPALVHRSKNLRVCWHRGSHGTLAAQVASARAAGVPEWMLGEFEDESSGREINDVEDDVDADESDMRVLEPAHHKVLGLDAPTVEGNKTLLGFLRLDTDLNWNSTEHLLQALREKVEAKKIRSLPNFIVGIKTADGRLVRPHLIWLLPIDMGVLNVDNKHLRKFKAVYYGLCRALGDLGADPQAPATSQLTKNPLSPLYHTECPTDEWPTLDEHASCLEMGLDRMTLMRETVATVTGETFRHSNEYFNGCLDTARRVMARWQHDREPIYSEAFVNGDYGLVIDRLQEALSALVVAEGMKPRSMEYVRHKVASWVVETWNPAKVSGAALPARGRLGHIVADVRGVAERQAVAGRYSAKIRADKTLERLLEACNRLAVNGMPSKSALARASGLSRQTVHNRFEDLQAALSDRSVKDAVMLYGRAVAAHPEISSFAPEQSAKCVGNDVAIPEQPSMPLLTEMDDERDEEILAAHEAWIAVQEGQGLAIAALLSSAFSVPKPQHAIRVTC
ncbi:hypothetical protein [Rhizobium leguminosarum]